VTIRLRSYRDNPVVFVRLPRAHWLIVRRMAITRGARRSDVIREAVANAVAAVDPAMLLPRTPINPLRHPRWWIKVHAWETRPYRWLRRLKLAARTRANGGICSIEIWNPHMGFFAQLNFCLAIFQYCERHELAPHIRCTSPNYVDPKRGPDWLEYFFSKPQSAPASEDLTKVRYKTTINDMKAVALGVRPHTSLEDAMRVFNRHLIIKPYIIETVDRFWQAMGSSGPVVGIHYRGTDKSLEAPRVSLEHCLKVVKRYIGQNPKMSAVFVASDEQRFIDLIKESLAELPVFSRDDHYRSRDGQPIHNYKTEGGGYEKGEDALVNALLLSKCATLIRTTSLLSAWASLFNPQLKVILLNKAYDNRTWYPETEIITQPSTEYCPETLS
jgi:Nodulation protein Z (NodZ)